MRDKVKKFGSSINSKVKAFGLRIRVWLSSPNNREITTFIVTILVLFSAIGTLAYTNIQVNIARLDLEIARTDLEARTRPYLSIEKIRLGNTDYGWISTNITINNLGETPSTRIQFGEISLNGTKIAGTSQPDKDYPARGYTTEDGVTITTGGLVVTPMHSGLPYDIIFFPQKPITIELLTCGSIQMSAITKGSVIAIGLNYSWGDKQYEYVATAVMSDGEWRVKLESGD
jgi:hypothetical protein